MKKISLYALIAIILDVIVKLIVINKMVLGETIKVINNFLDITYIRNNGAAFGILTGNRIFLIIFSLIALVLIYVFFIKDKHVNNLEVVSYSLLIGGIIGNLIDRAIYGYVIDYIDINLFGYGFPVFNLADICITISVILFCINMFRGEKNVYHSN